MKANGSSRVMGPTSDLVVLAPWKRGIIGADEAILPRSRFQQTFDGLYNQRRVSRESQITTFFADPIERIEQVHSFRIVGREDGLLLAVTYDFGWEGYMRALHGPGGPFLDLMLANCEGYVPTRHAGVGQWAAWVKAREIPATYFYAATRLTVGDLYGLNQAEQRQRDEPDQLRGDRYLAGFSSVSPEEDAAQNRKDNPHETIRQGMRALAGLYRLTRFYGADALADSPLREDAETLLRFAKATLGGWAPSAPVPGWESEIAWFSQEPVGPANAANPTPRPVPHDPGNVQRGIITGFDRPGTIVHGAALFLIFDDAAAARESLAGLDLANEADAAGADADGDAIFRNIAFSFGGLRQLGLPAALLDAMPEAFRQGAAARAGQLGDVRGFHPAHWKPLPRNWPPGSKGAIDTDVIDAVIQLRTRSDGGAQGVASAHARLDAEIARLAALKGLCVVSTERLGPADPDAALRGEARDHFGYHDGISQPRIGPTDPADARDEVAAGDLLCGHANGRGDPAACPPELKEGSFLAIRRMPMHRDAFDALVADAAGTTRLQADVIKTKLLGRAPDGTSPITGKADNAFDYHEDRAGLLCPRQSHVRRVNPRTPAVRGETAPRIMRRGMSFGDPWTRTGDQRPRGSLFMAYCANLEQQYEVVLNWINGGNSTRIGSYLPDPLFSPPQAKPRTFRFLDGDTPDASDVHRCQLAAAADPVVGLDWSLYLFVPSLGFMRGLARLPDRAGAARPAADPRIHAMAEALVERFLAQRADEARWRTALDEPAAFRTGLQRAVWSVIRDRHAGVLVTEDLVLVGSHARVIEVLADDGRRFSVAGAGLRIVPSIEKFHLGLDAWTDAYRREAAACNDALASIPEHEAFDLARARTAARLAASLSRGPARADLVRHVLEPVAAAMAPHWFGLPDGRHIAPGASDWQPVHARKPLFPGDYWNPSRFAFNPFTSERTAQLSQQHGQAILDATEAYIAATGRPNLENLAKRMAEHRVTLGGKQVLAYPTDRDLARGLTGAMLGWVATTLGNGARLLDLWATSGEFARLQALWFDRPAAKRDFAAADAHFGPAIVRAMMLQPVPENKWRVVAADGVELGGHALRPGRKVVLGLQSAAADQAARGLADSHIAFGMNADTSSPRKPPHGCPGRGMAMGMLLGVATALADAVHMRPAGSAFAVDLTPLT